MRPMLSRRGLAASRPSSGTELVAKRDGLAASDVDGGHVWREVAVADDDAMPALGQRQLGERRCRSGRRAIDLDLSPRADGDVNRAGGRCDRRRGTTGDLAIPGFACLAGTAVACRLAL